MYFIKYISSIFLNYAPKPLRLSTQLQTETIIWWS